MLKLYIKEKHFYNNKTVNIAKLKKKLLFYAERFFKH